MIRDIQIAEKLGLVLRNGYWEVGGAYFFNKAECLRHASTLKDYNVRYHFYDSIYKSLNWSVEPKESLKELYKKRAQQLRDTYDYLILSFSGGSDSTNILKTFIDNNIKLDEVYCEYPIEAIESSLELFNGDREDPTQIIYEWVAAAKPILEKLSKTHPEIKITVESSAKENTEIIQSCQIHKLDRSGIVFNSNTRWHKLYETVRARTSHGRVGCISGVDKPRLSFNPKTTKFLSAYADTNNLSSFTQSARDESGYDLFFDHFYLAHECPEINQKQCFIFKHKILEVLKSNNVALYKSLLLRINENGVHVYDTHHDFFKSLLYDFWDGSIYQAGKSDNFFYPPNQKWYYDYIADDKRTNDFLDKQISELLYGIDDYFIVKQNGKPSNLKHFVTQPIEF